MSWTIRVKGDATPYVALGTITTRCIVGTPVLSRTVTTGTGSEVPGVLRYRVTRVSGDVAFCIISVVNPGDMYHPLVNLTEAPIMIDSNPILPTVQAGDIWEIGYGYYWDAVGLRWQPIRGFGVLVPGQTGGTLSIEITSAFSRPQIYSRFAWSNNGPSLWAARIYGNSWGSVGAASLSLRDDTDIDGLVMPGGSCVVEVRADPPTSADNTNNPITLTMALSSDSI